MRQRFSPDFTSDPSVAAAARKSLTHVNNGSSVTNPVDDSSPLMAPSIKIPVGNSSPVMARTIPVDDSSFSTTPSPALSSPSTPSLNGSTSRSRKRPSSDVDKDPQLVADELALKRAKNTDAARRSRLRRVMKMESLE